MLLTHMGYTTIGKYSRCNVKERAIDHVHLPDRNVGLPRMLPCAVDGPRLVAMTAERVGEWMTD